MTKKRSNFQQKEERYQPDRPVGLVDVAANNRAFAARLIGEFRLAKAGVKHGSR
ncbi:MULTISPECIES: hypothetical protein [Rosenbergiella]|uniref:hypothetical protein n=1 Tax=Rosenbergiella TaxID=1356488 RepID=UPI001F4ED2A0|nr:MULTISPECIES: hypothetical protein [Rosenbergiella]